MRNLLGAVLICCLVGGCTSGDAGSTTVPSIVTTEAPAGTETTTASTPPTTSGATTTVSEPTEPPATPEPVGSPYFEGLLVPAILLRTPTSGGGERPLLEWEPLDDVARYELFIFTESGRIYWAWSTTGTEVFVGGIEPTPAGLRVPGPRIQPEMSWAVLGFDREGMLVAQSERRPIAP